MTKQARTHLFKVTGQLQAVTLDQIQRATYRSVQSLACKAVDELNSLQHACTFQNNSSLSFFSFSSIKERILFQLERQDASKYVHHRQNILVETLLKIFCRIPCTVPVNTKILQVLAAACIWRILAVWIRVRYTSAQFKILLCKSGSHTSKKSKIIPLDVQCSERKVRAVWSNVVRVDVVIVVDHPMSLVSDRLLQQSLEFPMNFVDYPRSVQQ